MVRTSVREMVASGEAGRGTMLREAVVSGTMIRGMVVSGMGVGGMVVSGTMIS